jgi:hypothetical protein
MKVGDLVVLNKSPFEYENVFGYSNGDIGIIKKKIRGQSRLYNCCIVLLLKDLKEYNIPQSYMSLLEEKC